MNCSCIRMLSLTYSYKIGRKIWCWWMFLQDWLQNILAVLYELLMNILQDEMVESREIHSGEFPWNWDTEKWKRTADSPFRQQFQLLSDSRLQVVLISNGEEDSSITVESCNILSLTVALIWPNSNHFSCMLTETAAGTMAFIFV